MALHDEGMEVVSVLLPHCSQEEALVQGCIYQDEASAAFFDSIASAMSDDGRQEDNSEEAREDQVPGRENFGLYYRKLEACISVMEKRIMKRFGEIESRLKNVELKLAKDHISQKNIVEVISFVYFMF